MRDLEQKSIKRAKILRSKMTDAEVGRISGPTTLGLTAFGANTRLAPTLPTSLVSCTVSS